MPIIASERTCSRCSAVQGSLHPIFNETVYLETFTSGGDDPQLVCNVCAMQLEARAVKRSVNIAQESPSQKIRDFLWRYFFAK